MAEFDYVIVGGGAAGSVVARRLSERLDRSVCLIETGPSDERPEILELPHWAELLESEFDYAYEIEPQERSNDAMTLSRGRVLGGSGSINTCVAWRAPDRDMRTWEESGAAGWGPEATRPLFDRVLERTGIESSGPGTPIAKAFLEAGEEAGLPRRGWNGDATSSGVGFASFTKRGSLRRSASVSYLHPLSSLPSNLSVQTDTRALRIRLDDNGDAVGVETDRGLILARRELVISCGAYDSPRLLMLSGIGPAAELSKHGIPVAADLPVGRHLLDHVEAAPVTVTSARDPGERPMLGVDAAVLTHVTDEPGDDPEAIIWLYAGSVGESLTERTGKADSERQFSLGNHLLYTQSEGTVTLRSANPDDPPRIDPRYFTDPHGYDERTAAGALRWARRLLAQPALSAWVESEIFPGPDVGDGDDELSAYARSRAHTDYHPAGTCKMGAATDPSAVVDPELRVRGVGRLRVADASIFPTMVGVNPVVTIMMIGEHCADLMTRSG
jgi:choline oxidase